MSSVLRHVLGAIGPASEAAATRARDAVRGAGTPLLERIAAAVAGAQHAAPPRARRRALVVAIGDHGCGDPGLAMGAAHPTVVAARAIAEGTAAVCRLARPTPILVIDAGAREPAHLPPIAVRLGRGPSRDLAREPAQSVVDAVLGLEAGIALSLTLADHATVRDEGERPDAPRADGPAVDVVALGTLGVGVEIAAVALLGALTGASELPDQPDEATERALAQGIAARGGSGLELLAQFGGPETAVLAGLMLGLSSMHVPVILDSVGTGAAALVACALAPDVRGALLASHRGTFPMPAILDHLGLAPAFEVGLGHGDGTGAAMLLPLLDQAAALATPGG